MRSDAADGGRAWTVAVRRGPGRLAFAGRPGSAHAHAHAAVQMLIAVLVADAGITLVHYASHRIGWLWRLHAVHHSVKRCYGFNGT